jgi:hypothetical protein
VKASLGRARRGRAVVEGPRSLSCWLRRCLRPWLCLPVVGSTLRRGKFVFIFYRPSLEIALSTSPPILAYPTLAVSQRGFGTSEICVPFEIIIRVSQPPRIPSCPPTGKLF